MFLKKIACVPVSKAVLPHRCYKINQYTCQPSTARIQYTLIIYRITNLLALHRRVSRNRSRGGGHFSKFSTRVAKMSISLSSAYSHGEMYNRMFLAFSVFLWTYRETIRMSPTLQCTLISLWWNCQELNQLNWTYFCSLS